MQRSHSAAVQDDHLARLDIANELGVDQVEGASFRGQDVCIAKLSQAEGAETTRVADAVDAVLEEHDQRVCPHHFVERFRHGLRSAGLAGAGKEMQNNFRIAGGLEDVALVLEVAPDGAGVHQIPIMSQGHLALIATHFQGLSILKVCVACRRVARVPDSQMPRQAFNDIGGEDLVHVSHALLAGQRFAVGNSDAGAFLSPVLKRVKTEVCQFRGFGVPINANTPQWS